MTGVSFPAGAPVNLPGLGQHNPDILTCLANLSADEVFTPPKLANAMLDILPQELFRDPTTTFLDPFTKSGVFLREIASRLNKGLANQMPDDQTRVDHILTRQVFGIATSELTWLLARRSLYCSKKADGRFSICTQFDTPHGHVRLPRTKHLWNDKGRCEQCGANRENYERDDALEAYAYPFIHGINPEEEFGVKFDVIIGNPPYQLSDGGFGRSASPIYPDFVRQAKKLEPRHLTMVIPSRWFGGGKGLEGFREEMLGDEQLQKLIDYEDANDVFAGIDMAGGVCYFLWERRATGKCEVTNISGGKVATSKRLLNEFPTFIRHKEAVSIIRKIEKHSGPRMNSQVTSRKPFGLPTTERPAKTGDLILRWQKGEGPFPAERVTAGHGMIDKWKVITSYVGYDHAGNPGKDGRRRVLSKIDIIPPGTICNETYLVTGAYYTEAEANNLVSYMKTKLFRFLMSQFMYSHHLTSNAYSLVPVLDVKTRWTDERLAQLFELTTREACFIDSKIREYE